MKRSCLSFFQLGLLFSALLTFSAGTWGAEYTVQIRSPKDGSQITQEQAYVLISGKAVLETGGSGSVDIFLVVDVSGSTTQYSGAEFGEFSQLPNFNVNRGRLGGRGLPCAGPGRPGPLNLRNSILAAEILASRRLLSKLDPERTRVGVIAFGEDTSLRQPLTRYFEKVHGALDSIYKHGPYGGTNMVDAITVATDELLGKGKSERSLDSIKALVFFTDGFPTRPTADCSSTNADMAINAARLAGQAGINVYVFALGEEALSNPRAAVAIARESGGSYTAVTRPADVLAVVDKISAVGVDWIQVTNETIQQKALRSHLAADGFFSSAVPVVEGLNRIQALGRASDGSLARDVVTVNYQPAAKRSLELEIFLEREKTLKLEIDRLDQHPEQIQRQVEVGPLENLKTSVGSSPAADKTSGQR